MVDICSDAKLREMVDQCQEEETIICLDIVVTCPNRARLSLQFPLHTCRLY